MRIGHKDNSLSIEKVGKDSSPIWRLEAIVVGAGWMFAGMCDRVLVDTTAEAVPRMSDFAAQRRQQFEVELSDGGWLRLKRDASGRLLIRYRFGRIQAGAAVEGEIVLEAEAAKPFCKELITLL